jgi:hypothetical protein
MFMMLMRAKAVGFTFFLPLRPTRTSRPVVFCRLRENPADLAVRQTCQTAMAVGAEIPKTGVGVGPVMRSAMFWDPSAAFRTALRHA